MKKEWEIFYYNIKLREWIDSMPESIRVSYAKITKRMKEYGSNLGMPHTKPMGNGLFEIRAKGKDGIGRVFYCTVKDNRIFMLHAFIKKTQQTPPKELETAKKRMEEVKNAYK